MATAEQWPERIAHLRVYKAKGGPAPHKPLPLLVALELAEQGYLPNGILPLTPALAFRFCTYWNIVAAYNYTCALTGYRLTTITAGSIVDAAHIHQFSDSRNNDPRNGIALCKNAHWLFDNGLWALSDDYRVVVAVGRFTEQSPDQKAL